MFGFFLVSHWKNKLFVRNVTLEGKIKYFKREQVTGSSSLPLNFKFDHSWYMRDAFKIEWCSDNNHSHKKRKDSPETWAVLKEMSMLCWNIPSGPKHRGSLRKNTAYSEGKNLFVWNFRANLDETNADMVQFTKRWNWKWII